MSELACSRNQLNKCQAYLEGIKIADTEADFAKQVIGKYTKTTGAADLKIPIRRSCRPGRDWPLVPAPDVQTLLDFATHLGTKAAKPETFIDNSILC